MEKPPSVYKWLLKFLMINQIFMQEMVGNHHFHPFKTDGLEGTRNKRSFLWFIFQAAKNGFFTGVVCS